MIKAPERKVTVPTIQGLKPAQAISALHDSLVSLASASNYHDDTLTKALRGGISSGNNSRLKYVDVNVTMPPEAPWLLATLINSWAPISGRDPCAFLMEPGGRASLRMEAGGSSATSGLAATTLPEGYRPPTALEWLTGNSGMLIDGSNGHVNLTRSSTAVTVAFGTVSWFASPAAGPHPFSINGATWPMKVRHGLGPKGVDQCLNCDPVACVDVTQNAKMQAPLPQLVWQDVGNGQLRLDGTWGLAWGRKYLVRLRCSSEE